MKAKYTKPNDGDSRLLASSRKYADHVQAQQYHKEEFDNDINFAAQNIDDFPDEGIKKLRVSIDLHLNHGDVIVMKGKEIQRLYEHSVTPLGLFRIAATARFVHEAPQETTTITPFQGNSSPAYKLLASFPNLGMDETAHKNFNSVDVPMDDVLPSPQTDFQPVVTRREQTCPVDYDSPVYQEGSTHKRRNSFHIPNVQEYAMANGYENIGRSTSYSHDIRRLDHASIIDRRFSWPQPIPESFSRFKESFERGSVDASLSSGRSEFHIDQSYPSRNQAALNISPSNSTEISVSQLSPSSVSNLLPPIQHVAELPYALMHGAPSLPPLAEALSKDYQNTHCVSVHSGNLPIKMELTEEE